MYNSRLRCNKFLVGKISAKAEVYWPARTHKIKAVNNIINTQGNILPFSVAETLEIIEKLAHLKELGALSESEFNTKKTELLQRI